ncbi:MAG: ribosomal protein L7/L12 [Anaerolineaceae bacterium]|nr:ribosomal protein L7/L12 [Anaerolineaceae bacterium]
MSKPLWDVVLVGFTDRTAVLEVIKNVTGKEISETRAMTDELPATVLGNVTRGAANEFKDALESAGATIMVRQVRAE